MKKLLLIFLLTLCICSPLTKRQESNLRKLGLTLLATSCVSYMIYREDVYSHDFMTFAGASMVTSGFFLFVSIPIGK
jgi:hypothetical protein